MLAPPPEASVARKFHKPHRQIHHLLTHHSDSSTPVLSLMRSIRESWPKSSTRHMRRSTSTCRRPALVSRTSYSTRRSHGPDRRISRKKSRNLAVCSSRTSRSTLTKLPLRSSKLVSNSERSYYVVATDVGLQVHTYRGTTVGCRWHVRP